MKRTVYSIDDPKSTEEFVNFWRPIRTHFRGHFRYLVRLGFGTVGNITFVVTLILNCVINRLIFGPEYMVRSKAFFIAEAVLFVLSYAGGMLFAQSRWKKYEKMYAAVASDKKRIHTPWEDERLNSYYNGEVRGIKKR